MRVEEKQFRCRLWMGWSWGLAECWHLFWFLNSLTLWPYCRHFKDLGLGHRRRQWQPTPVLLPGKSLGRRNLVGCSPWGCEESDMAERLHFHFSLSCIGEGNGNPLQCSCLENPKDRGAWWAAVYGVTQSRNWGGSLMKGFLFVFCSGFFFFCFALLYFAYLGMGIFTVLGGEDQWCLSRTVKHETVWKQEWTEHSGFWSRVTRC